jgi:creatinine amidohydrolase
MARAEASPAKKGAATGPLTPTDSTSPNYCPSGSYGDPTLASREKGEILLAAIMDDIVEQASTFLTACAGEPRDAIRSLSR